MTQKRGENLNRPILSKARYIYRSEARKKYLLSLFSSLLLFFYSCSYSSGEVSIGSNTYGPQLRHWRDMTMDYRKTIACWHMLGPKSNWCTCVCVCIAVCLCVFLWVCVDLCVCVCVFVCTCICVWVCGCVFFSAFTDWVILYIYFYMKNLFIRSIRQIGCQEMRYLHLN